MAILKSIAVLLLCNIDGISADLPACSSSSLGPACDSTFGGGTFPLEPIWHSTWTYEANFGVSWSPDGRYLARPHTRDHTVLGIYEFVDERLWLVGAHTIYDYWVQHVEFSPDGKFVAYTYDYENVVVLELRTMNSGHTVQLSINAIVHMDHGSPQSFAFSPDGKHIAVPRAKYQIPTRPGTYANHLSVFRFSPNEEFSKDRLVEASFVELEKTPATSKSVSWSNNGKYIAIGTSDYEVIVYEWDLPKNALKPGVVAVYDTNENPIRSLDWSPDGTLLVAADNNGKIWLFSFSAAGALGLIGTETAVDDDGSLYSAVRFSPDGAMISASRGWLDVLSVPHLNVLARCPVAAADSP